MTAAPLESPEIGLGLLSTIRVEFSEPVAPELAHLLPPPKSLA